MDLDPRNPVPSLTYFCQGKSVEELRQIVIYANVELQNVRLQAQEEIRKRDEELRLFRNVLSQAMRERDEAQAKLQKVLVEKLTHQAPDHQEVKHQALAAPVSGVTSIEDELKRGGFSSSEGDESIVSSPVVDPSQAQLSISFHEEVMELLVQEKRPLPEKGKLLDAVMTAGPLLQTLLLAGPLPQWRHPPPPLEPSQIPPVAVPSPPPPPAPLTLLHRGVLPSMADYSCINECGRLDRKRSSMEGSASSAKTKYQRILLN
uniref:Uncharacterized protein n=1 Tax=Kalanchoe fedtschenkoi TaxID=63787 RepID=A0A7N0TSV5_KALFE